MVDAPVQAATSEPRPAPVRPVMPTLAGGRRGALVTGWFKAEPTGDQLKMLETVLRSRRHFPPWIEVVDVHDDPPSPEVLVSMLTRRPVSCAGLLVLDDDALEWAGELCRSVKQADGSIRTVVVAPGPARALADVLRSRPMIDAVIPLDPILASTPALGSRDPQFPAWRLAGASLIDALARLFAGHPGEEIDGIVFRTAAGEIVSRDRYQPVLFGDAYYGEWAEKTVVDEADLAAASAHNASLLYGEVAEPGGIKMLSEAYCDAGHAEVLYDLGMGTGRLALQAFATCPSLRRVVGVELSRERYEAAARGARTFAAVHGLRVVEQPRGVQVLEDGPSGTRRLEFVHGDLFDVPVSELQQAQVVLLLTDIPEWDRFDTLVNALRPGTRVATMPHYDLSARPHVRVESIPSERTLDDGFATSWSPSYNYLVWRRVQ